MSLVDVAGVAEILEDSEVTTDAAGIARGDVAKVTGIAGAGPVVGTGVAVAVVVTVAVAAATAAAVTVCRCCC